MGKRERVDVRHVIKGTVAEDEFRGRRITVQVFSKGRCKVTVWGKSKGKGKHKRRRKKREILYRVAERIERRFHL